ncbi:MAG: glycosyltransferase [Bacteroidota bacterium]
MKVALLIPNLMGGGAERVMVNLSAGFRSANWIVHMVLLQPVGEYLQDLPSEVSVIDLKSKGMIRGIPALVKYLRAERPDVMVSAMEYVNVVALVARFLGRVPTRTILTVHVTISQTLRHTRSWKEKLLPFFMRLLYPFASAIVAVSRGSADDLARVAGIPRERIYVVHNPVLTPSIESKRGERVDQPWFEPGQPPVILGVGRFVPQKDFLTLIRAFSIVRREHRSRLVLLGNGPMREEYLSLSRTLGIEDDMLMPGFVDNPYAMMSRSKVFVLSSSWEALPTVLIEALVCGTSVVSTDCENGPREILDLAGVGTLVPVGNHVAMAHAILNSFDAVPCPVREAFVEEFDARAAVDKYVDIINQVASR